MAATSPRAVRTSHRPRGTVGSGTASSAVPDRVMLSPITDPGPDQPPPERQARRPQRAAVGMLIVTLTVLLGAVFAISASTAAPAARQPSAPATPPSFPVPSPTTCASYDSLCQALNTTTTAPSAPTAPPQASTSSSDPCDAPDPPAVCAPSTTATPTTPCTGEDCLPQATTPAPGSGGHPGQPGGDTGEPECGLTNLSGCIARAINAVFKSIVDAALSPILDLLGHTALSTPTLDQLPGIGELWQNSWEIVLAVYGLLILVAGIVVMSHESVQTRYSIKEIGPRIPIGFLASMLSLFFTDKLIRIANALSQSVLGDEPNAPSLGSGLEEAVAGATSGGLFIILMGLVLVVVGIGLLIVYVIRVVITLILIISGPLFLMCHCLPHTDPLARWWWKALAATLAIQVAQALVLITAVRTFLAGGVHLFGSTMSALGTVIAAIALFYILFKIPFWLLGAVKVSSGRSLLGGLARAYVAAKTFGMVAGRSGAFSRAGTAAAAASSGGNGRGGGPGGGSPSPDPPFPAQPYIAPTPEAVNRRMREQYDAEGIRAARRARVRSLAPRFLQPSPQSTTHDPAISPATQRTSQPAFSAAPTRDTPVPRPPGSWRGGHASGAPPPFQAPGRASAPPAPAARPVQVAPVPPRLRFQPPAPEPAHQARSTPTPASPAAPVFRAAHPEPHIGDARARNPSVPPVAFRAPRNPT